VVLVALLLIMWFFLLLLFVVPLVALFLLVAILFLLHDSKQGRIKLVSYQILHHVLLGLFIRVLKTRDYILVCCSSLSIKATTRNASD
jgi:hypothetical protein